MDTKNDIFLDLINSVESKELVLPDFQRKFVWKKDMMLKLYTSVLCRMPLGSILILKSSDDQFACKEIGAKIRTDAYNNSIPKGKELCYLIDGQQRLTTLLAGFSTRFLERFLNTDECAKESLTDFYFLRIPSSCCTEKELDIFNAANLDFNAALYKSDKFLQSNIVNKLITSARTSEVITIDKKKGQSYDLNDENQKNQFIAYCSTEDKEGFFKIPLQFINSRNQNIKNVLNSIVMAIAGRFAVNEDVNARMQKIVNWTMSVNEYLTFCLSNIDLNKITVENSDKIRAIDIYSNLNIGGVALSVFDLLMAKVGSVEKDNFYEMLVRYIQNEDAKGYPKTLYKDEDRNWLSQESYLNASTQIAKVIDTKYEEISKEYINVFLNVLAMYITQKNRDKSKAFDVNCIKQDKILELDAKQVRDSAQIVCQAIDRALFFFQTRCGIRKISDINYLAQLVVIAYFFTDDKLFNRKDTFEFFEYWYWISIFAYKYPSNQNIEIYKEIPRFEMYFENRKKNIDVLNGLKKYQTKVLNCEDYSDFDTLAFTDKAKKTPPSVMTQYICQYYLAVGYRDLCTDTTLNFFTTSELEAHHIMPLGSDPAFKADKISYNKSTLELRKKKENPYNSPLNMLYITPESNKNISDMDYQTYSQNQKIKDVLSLINCETVISDDYTLENFLQHRYNGLKALINKRLDGLYNCLTK